MANTKDYNKIFDIKVNAQNLGVKIPSASFTERVGEGVTSQLHLCQKNVLIFSVVYQLAILQSEMLDGAMLKSMYLEHKRNKPAESSKKAVIVGGAENFLGTAFEECFDQTNGKIHNGSEGISNEKGEINLKKFETALKKRLQSLAHYVHAQKDNEGAALELIFGQCVDKIQFPKMKNSEYKAVLSNNKLIVFDLLQLDELKSRLDKKWLAALVSSVIRKKDDHSSITSVNMEREKKAGMLNFDSNLVNSHTFNMILYSLDQAAVEYNVFGNAAVVLAVGDSAVTPHYFTDTVLTTGKIGVETAAKHIKEYNDANITDSSRLLQKLNENFKKLREQVSTAAKHPDFTIFKYEEKDFYSTAQVNKKACEVMRSEINKIVDQINAENDHDFNIIEIATWKKSHYKIEFAENNFFFVMLTENGHLQVLKTTHKIKY
uniref:Uncharacterized protein n=1 Tax=Ditylenchus dipsaci TaxID=166011 RepID=A0A915ELH9_9BILA